MRGWLIALLAVVTLAGCGGPTQVVDVGDAPRRGGDAAATPQAGGPDEAEPTQDPGSAEPASGGDAGPAGGPGQQPPATEPATPDTTIVVVYLTQGEQITALPRTVTRVPRIGAAALQELLAGPTADEAAAGYGTEIPPATRLRGLTITDGVAVVDLSGDFESGGGTLGLTLRLAQVACTLDQFPTVDGVRFALDGTVVDVFSGDGLIIDEPVACSDYADVVAE